MENEIIYEDLRATIFKKDNIVLGYKVSLRNTRYPICNLGLDGRAYFRGLRSINFETLNNLAELSKICTAQFQPLELVMA